jgi:hypothetical protein
MAFRSMVLRWALVCLLIVSSLALSAVVLAQNASVGEESGSGGKAKQREKREKWRMHGRVLPEQSAAALRLISGSFANDADESRATFSAAARSVISTAYHRGLDLARTSAFSL